MKPENGFDSRRKPKNGLLKEEIREWVAKGGNQRIGLTKG
jgi:hypothetical protein